MEGKGRWAESVYFFQLFQESLKFSSESMEKKKKSDLSHKIKLLINTAKIILW